MAIMVPLTVTMMIDQIDAPSDTAASSSALAWPVMATSATPMPTVASCPTSIGHASRHRAAASMRMEGRVKEVGMALGVLGKAAILLLIGAAVPPCRHGAPSRRVLLYPDGDNGAASKIKNARAHLWSRQRGIQGLLQDAGSGENGDRGRDQKSLSQAGPQIPSGREQGKECGDRKS